MYHTCQARLLSKWHNGHLIANSCPLQDLGSTQVNISNCQYLHTRWDDRLYINLEEGFLCHMWDTSLHMPEQDMNHLLLKTILYQNMNTRICLSLLPYLLLRLYGIQCSCYHLVRHMFDKTSLIASNCLHRDLGNTQVNISKRSYSRRHWDDSWYIRLEEDLQCHMWDTDLHRWERDMNFPR